jgi:hypothetical protein
VVQVPLDTLAAAARLASGAELAGLAPALLSNGHPLSSTALREVAASADWTAVLVDRRGSPLDVGRTQRLFTPKQRVAVTVRDGGCTYPTCAAPPASCDVHHLKAWSAGGRTDLDNAALLCGRHHRHVTHTGKSGRVVDGHVLWDETGPAPPSQPGRLRRLVDDLVRRCRLPAGTADG